MTGAASESSWIVNVTNVPPAGVTAGGEKAAVATGAVRHAGAVAVFAGA